MKPGRFVLSLIAIAVASTMAARAQQAPGYTYPHMSHSMHLYYQQHPAEWQQLLERLPRVSLEQPAARPPAPAQGSLVHGDPGAKPSGIGTWTKTTYQPPVALGNPIMLTDGTIMAISELGCIGKWYRFTPDLTSGFNAYLNGTWTRMDQQPPAGYGPRFFGSAVLADERVIIEGGEYNTDGKGGCLQNDTTLGAIYDPVANTWTAVSPPSGWTKIGDGGGIVLPNGTYMQTPCCSGGAQAALLNPATLGWTATGTGKFDAYEEESLALLGNDRVLTVDSYWSVSGQCGKNSEAYNYTTGAWSSVGNTTTQQDDCSGLKTYEIGPLVMNPWGSAFSFPGLTNATTSNVNVFDPVANQWSTASVLPSAKDCCGNTVPYTMADAPAAVLPNGNILVAMSPNNWGLINNAFPTPTHFWEYNPFQDSFTQAGDMQQAANFNSYEHNFLVLPNGTIMAFGIDAIDVEIYTPSGDNLFPPQFQPSITSLPSCVSPGGSFIASGTQFNGLTEGAYYGDDTQASTNFPMALLLSQNGQSQFIAQTFSFSSRSIAPNAATSTSFRVPPMPTGAYLFYIIANGIPSLGKLVAVETNCSQTASHDFNGDGKSDILWRDTSGDVAMWLMNGTSILSSAGVGGASPSVWSIVGQRDFNGDGKADILWHDTSGNVAMWFMNGASVTGSSGVGNANPSVWSIAGTGDFNGDGKGDILWHDNSGNVAMWMMNGASIAQSCGVGNANPSVWSIAATGDFNGDGNTDILWHDNSGNVAIWFMNGCSILQSSGVGNANPSVWSIAGTGDFNSDGKADILWHDTAGNVAMWMMNGAAILQSAGVGNANPSVWSIAETGDVNSDGKTDILWHDTSGNVAVWEMNGASILQSAGIGNASASVWTLQGLNAD